MASSQSSRSPICRPSCGTTASTSERDDPTPAPAAATPDGGRDAGTSPTGALVSGCSGAVRTLGGDDATATHVVDLLATLLETDPESAA